nr:mucin-2-like [Lytechinus pictus]
MSGQGILLANLTGSTYPTKLTSPVNNLWVRFTSDYSITAPGFSIKVKAVPLTDAVTTENIATTLETVSQSTTSPSLSTSHYTDPTVSYLSEEQTLLTTMKTASTRGVSGSQEMVEHSTGSVQESSASSSSDMLFSTDTIDLTTMETAPTSMQLMDDAHTSELVTTDTIPATSPVVSKNSAHITSKDTTFEMIGTVTPEDSSQYSTQSNLQTTITPSSGSTIPLTSSDTTSLPLQTLTMMTETDSNKQSESTLETTAESTVSLNPSDTKLKTEETNVVTTEVKDEVTSGTIKITHMYMQTSGNPTHASYEDTTLPYDSFTSLTSRLSSDIFHLTNMETSSNPSDAPNAQTSQEWEEPTTFIAQTLPEISEDPETPPSSTSAIGASIHSQTRDASTTQGTMKSVSITATSSDSNTALISASEATIRSTSYSTIEPNVDTTESESTQLPGTTHPADMDINLESGDSNTVQSPNYPSNYDNNLDYSWYITAPLDHTINIEFQELYLETGYDFLRFEYESSDGYSSRTSIANITGTSHPSVLICPVNNVWIRFTTDSSITKMGFSIVVTAVATTAVPTSATASTLLSSPTSPLTETAGSLLPSLSTAVAEIYINLTSGNSQTIQSRNYPSNYDNDIDSAWYITAPVDNTIRVDFGDFNLETNYDFLVFEYEPFPGSSSHITLANLTGTSYPSSLESPSNNLRIHFITDYSITKTGFSIGVTAISTTGMLLSTGATSTSQTASLTSIVNASPVEDTSYISTSTDGALSSKVMTMSTPVHSTLSSDTMESLNSGSSADMERTTSPEDFNLTENFTESRPDVTKSNDLAVATTSTSFTANMAKEITSGTTQQKDVLSEESTQTPKHFGSSHSFMSVISEFLSTTEPTTTSSPAVDVQTTPLVSRMITPNTATTSLTSQSHSPTRPMSTFTEQTSDTQQTIEEILTSLTPTTSDMLEAAAAGLTSEPPSSIYSSFSIMTTIPINFQTSVLQTDGALVSNIITERSETVAPVSQEYVSTELSSIASQTTPNAGTTADSEYGTGSSSNIITERSETVNPVSQEYVSTELSSISSQATPNAGTTADSEDGAGSSSNIITERSETVNQVSQEYVSTELSSISSQTTPNAGTTADSEDGTGSTSNIITERSETVALVSQEYVSTELSSILSQTTPNAGNTADSEYGTGSSSNIITERSETVNPVSQEYVSTELSSTSISSQTTPNAGTTADSEDGAGSSSNIITERSETVNPVIQEYVSTELSSISSQTTPNAGTTADSEDGTGSSSNIITERSETVVLVSQEYVSTESSSIASQTTPNIGTTADSEDGTGSSSNIITERSETVNPESQEFVSTVTSSILSQSTSAGNPEVSIESTSKVAYTSSESLLGLLVNSEYATGSTPLTSKTTGIPNLGEVTYLSSRVPTRPPTLNTDSALYDDTPFTSTPLNSMRTSMFTLQYTNRTMMKEYSLSTYQNATTVKCGKECLTHPICDSFAINKQMNKCILGLHTAVVGHIYEEINSFIYVATIKYS